VGDHTAESGAAPAGPSNSSENTRFRVPGLGDGDIAGVVTDVGDVAEPTGAGDADVSGVIADSGGVSVSHDSSGRQEVARSTKQESNATGARRRKPAARRRLWFRLAGRVE
jgi:hypothetical protein